MREYISMQFSFSCICVCCCCGLYSLSLCMAFRINHTYARAFAPARFVQRAGFVCEGWVCIMCAREVVWFMYYIYV